MSQNKQEPTYVAENTCQDIRYNLLSLGCDKEEMRVREKKCASNFLEIFLKIIGCASLDQTFKTMAQKNKTPSNLKHSP